MKSNLLKNTLKGIGLSVFMAAGLVAFTATDANAQYRDRDYRQDRRDDRRDRRNDRYDRYSNSLYRTAQQQGFRDGMMRGRDDRRDRDRFNPQKASEYKKGTNGYYNRLGNKNEYKNTYRQAFLQGYNAGYNGRGNNNGGNWGW